jgi:hypothetical protein
MLLKANFKQQYYLYAPAKIMLPVYMPVACNAICAAAHNNAFVAKWCAGF